MATFGVVGGALLGGSSATPLTRVQGSALVTVTASATPHTKGAWTQLIASTSGAATMVILDVSAVASTGNATAALIDLALGGAGAEAAVLSDLPVGSAVSPGTQGLSCFQVPLPVSVPAGSRISARIQSVVASKTASVGVTVFSGGMFTPGTLTVLGADTATSRGIALNTTWTEIVASSAATYRYIIPVPSASSTSLPTASGTVSIGHGASGNEVEDGVIAVATVNNETIGVPQGAASWAAHGIRPGVIAGSRLVLKRTDVACDGVIIGVA